MKVFGARTLAAAITIFAFYFPGRNIVASGGPGAVGGFTPVVTAEMGGGLSAAQGSFYGGGSFGFGFAAAGAGGAAIAFIKLDVAHDFTGKFAHFRAGPELWALPFTFSLEYLNLDGCSGFGIKGGYHIVAGTQFYTRLGLAGGGVFNIGIQQLLNPI